MAKKLPVPSTELPINEPLPDWMPLWKAPFFCLSDGRMHTERTWPAAFCKEMKENVSQLLNGPPDPDLDDCWYRPECNVYSHDDAVLCETKNLTTRVMPGSIYVFFDDVDVVSDFSPTWTMIFGRSDQIVEDKKWEEIPLHDAALWHKMMLKDLLTSLRRNFVAAVKTGAARLMARPNHVLSPFQRITWDQWNFFRLEEEQAERKRLLWWDPREPARTASAIGPNGERIYSIHVAPGDPAPGQSEKEKHLRWLTLFIRNNPDRCPIPLDELLELAGLGMWQKAQENHTFLRRRGHC